MIFLQDSNSGKYFNFFLIFFHYLKHILVVLRISKPLKEQNVRLREERLLLHFLRVD